MATTLHNGTAPASYDRTEHLDWIVPVTINIILTIVTIWILISLIHYGVKTKKWRHIQRKSDVLNAGLVYSSVILCAAMCLLRYAISLAFMNVGYNENDEEICNMLGDAVACAYALSTTFATLFLWFRQRAFYSNRLLNVNYSKIVKVFSVLSIVIIILYTVVVFAIIIPQNSLTSSPIGCVRRSSTEDNGYWIFGIVGALFTQPTLIGLLAYALLRAKSFQKASIKARRGKQMSSGDLVNTVSKNDPENTTSSEQAQTSRSASTEELSRRPKSSDKIRTILQKTIIFGVTSIICDFLIQGFANFAVMPSEHRRIVNVLYDANVFLNLLYLIFSFVTYKDILISPLKKY